MVGDGDVDVDGDGDVNMDAPSLTVTSSGFLCSWHRCRLTSKVADHVHVAVAVKVHDHDHDHVKVNDRAGGHEPLSRRTKRFTRHHQLSLYGRASTSNDHAVCGWV